MSDYLILTRGLVRRVFSAHNLELLCLSRYLCRVLPARIELLSGNRESDIVYLLRDLLITSNRALLAKHDQVRGFLVFLFFSSTLSEIYHTHRLVVNRDAYAHLRTFFIFLLMGVSGGPGSSVIRIATIECRTNKVGLLQSESGIFQILTRCVVRFHLSELLFKFK